ncbi:MAG: ATP-binding cassette domain-containing protein, partial [Verrucomicrobiota bacterium]
MTAVAVPGAAAVALEAVGLTKRFGGVAVLDDVSLRLAAGSFHALLGENGAGKSTLVKCIMGYHRADAGHVLVAGAPAAIKNPRDAAVHGIGMVYQHFTLVDNMTVAENLVLARQRHPFFFDWRAERREVAAFMQRMPFRLEVAQPVRTLSAGEKQKLEILKQLYLKRRFMILDEPTSVLTPAEADEVLGMLKKMAGENKVTVLMITHKFREVMAFADAVTVLRRGQFAGSGKVADLNPTKMAEMMVGEREIPQAKGEKSGASGEAAVPRLSIKRLDVDDDT